MAREYLLYTASRIEHCVGKCSLILVVDPENYAPPQSILVVVEQTERSSEMKPTRL